MWGFPPWPCQTSSAPRSPCALMSDHVPHLSPKGNPKTRSFIGLLLAGSEVGTGYPSTELPPHKALNWHKLCSCTLRAVSCPLHLHGIFRKSFGLMFCAAPLCLLPVNAPVPEFCLLALPFLWHRKIYRLVFMKCGCLRFFFNYSWILLHNKKAL